MFPGIDQHYRQIAEAVVEAVPDGWRSVTISGVYYPDSETWHPDYINSAGKLSSFELPLSVMRAFRSLRAAFRDAGKPTWGEVVFTLQPNGTFNFKFGYDNCDDNGDMVWDSEEWKRRHRERDQRLDAG